MRTIMRVVVRASVRVGALLHSIMCKDRHFQVHMTKQSHHLSIAIKLLLVRIRLHVCVYHIWKNFFVSD